MQGADCLAVSDFGKIAVDCKNSSDQDTIYTIRDEYSHMPNDNGNSWRNLQTVEAATEIIEALAELDGAGVTELADHLDISKSTVHSHLSTLLEADYLVRSGNEYQLSYQFLLLGEYVRNDSALFQFGRSRANDVAIETGHYSHLYVEEKGLGINIYEAKGEKAGNYEYQSLKLQQREPLHVTASGKAILACLPEKRVKEIIRRHGLDPYTENTITSEKELFEELDTISDQGYAINDEEEVEGFRAVAAPVQIKGAVIGSLSVSGPETIFSGYYLTDELPERLVNATNLIEVDINMSIDTR